MNPLTSKIVEAIKEKAYDWYGTQKVIKTEDANGIHIETVQDMSMRVDESELTAAIDKELEGEGWISVDDRLPEDRWDEHQYPNISAQQNILVDTGRVGTAAYDREKKVWFVGNLLEYYEGKNIIDEPRIKVIKWQPLPVPPK